MRKKIVITGYVLGLMGAGCAPAGDLEDDQTTRGTGALLAWDGLGNVEPVSFYSTDWTSTAWQSETTAVSGPNGFFYGAFNAEDTNTSHVTYPVRTERDSAGRQYVDRIVCPGTSQVGRVMYDPTFGQWTANRMPVPAGWDILWGDPAVSAFDGKWWVSALGSPTDRFRALSNTTLNGKSCFRTSDYPSSRFPDSFGEGATTPLAGAVVQGITLGTLNAPSSVTSFRRSSGVDSSTGNDFLDGGSLAAAGSALYAAYEDVATHTLAMYRRPTGGSWAAVAGDQAITTKDHPLVYSNSNYSFVWLLTESDGTITRRTHGSSGFSAPVTVATDYDNIDVTLQGGAVIRRGRGYAAVVGPNPGALTPASWIVYERQSGARKQLVLVRCTSTNTCGVMQIFGGTDPLTGRGSNAFMPAVAIAVRVEGSTTTHVLGLTYWSDQGLTGNQIQMRHYDLTLPSASLRSSGTLTKPQVACPGLGAEYIGDYDAMIVGNNATATPFFNRLTTDSTELTCDTTTRANLDFRAQDQHVSNVWYNVP